MAVLFTSVNFQAIGSTGLALPGALLYTYAAGTLTPLATYTTQAGSVENANPVVCDAAGQAAVWLGTSAYRFILKTAAGVTVRDTDNVTAQDVGVRTDLDDDASATKGAGMVGYGRNVAYGAGTVGYWLEKIIDERIIHVDDLGAVGDGSTDDETAILAGITASVTLGVPVVFDGTKTYVVDATSWTITAGARLRTNGCTFKNPTTNTSNTVWLTVGDGCVIDELNIDMPTGVRRDRLLTIGADCKVGDITVTTTDVQATDSLDFAVRVLGDRTQVGVIKVTSYDHPVTIYQSDNVRVKGVDLTGYVRGLYIFECADLHVGRSHIRTASANASFTSGHNGVLISNDTTGASHDITLEDHHIEDSGEHGMRIGGALTQSDIWIVRPHVKGVGGCGIKILGTDSITPTDRNGTIYLVDAIIEDCGTTALGSNEVGLLIMHVDRVRITNPLVRKIDNTYSSYACLRAVATADLAVVNPHFADAETDGIWLDGAESGDDNDRFSLSGGICRANGQDGVRIAAGANTVRRFNIDGLALDSNGRYGFNIAAGAGSITDSLLKVKTHNNTTGAGACDTAAVFMDVFGAPGGTAISGISAGNGSTWHDQTNFNAMKAGTWTAL